MIGARIPRNEDPRLLRGLGSSVDDIEPRGVLHAACLRSPHAHARITAIDAARARALPGVHLVLTAAELGALNQPSPLLIPHPGLGGRWDEAADPPLDVVAYTAPPREALTAR